MTLWRLSFAIPLSCKPNWLASLLKSSPYFCGQIRLAPEQQSAHCLHQSSAELTFYSLAKSMAFLPLGSPHSDNLRLDAKEGEVLYVTSRKDSDSTVFLR